MTPQLEELDSQALAISRRAGELFARAGEKFPRRPAPNRWSAAECLEHLRISTEAFSPVLTKTLSEARTRGLMATGPYRLDWVGRLLIWTLEPPPRFKFPAPAAFQPIHVLQSAKGLESFLDSQKQVRTLLQLAEGLALDKIKIRSPFDRRVRYSVWSAFCINASHQRRHLWQAERAVSDDTDDKI